MKQYEYTVDSILNDESQKPVYYNGENVGYVQRIYSNKLKKVLDHHFDFRYFLIYECAIGGRKFKIKKIFRRGKLWYEGKYEGAKEKTIITYDNWRIGIPELKIIEKDFFIKIEKEFEEPSRFYEGDVCIATWQAVFDEASQSFSITLQITDEATVQDPAYYIAISQATLFIGA
jgi:hypothetical protein